MASVELGVAVGKIFGEGPSLGDLSSIGKIGSPAMEVTSLPSIPIINEGPVGEITFNSIPSVLEQAEDVAAVAWKTNHINSVPEEAGTPVILPKVEQNNEPKLGIMANVFQAQRTQVALEAAGMIDLSQSVAKALSQPAPQPVLVEETLKEEEVAEETDTKENSRILEEQEIEVLRLRYVEDTDVSEARKAEIREAIRKAQVELESGSNNTELNSLPDIQGWMVAKFLSPKGNRSGILEEEDPKGLVEDGSRVETIEELASRNYKTEEEANAKSAALVSEKQPVKRAKSGKSVATQAVDRVRKYIPFGRSQTGSLN